MQLTTHGPRTPVVEVGVELEVHKTIRKRVWHSKDDRTIFFAIACRNDDPTVRQLILTDAPIKNELIETRLHDRWRRIEFVEEQNSRWCTCARKKRWREPFRAITDNCGNAAKISWIEQRRANINEWHAAIARELRD